MMGKFVLNVRSRTVHDPELIGVVCLKGLSPVRTPRFLRIIGAEQLARTPDSPYSFRVEACGSCKPQCPPWYIGPPFTERFECPGGAHVWRCRKCGVSQ